MANKALLMILDGWGIGNQTKAANQGYRQNQQHQGSTQSSHKSHPFSFQKKKPRILDGSNIRGNRLQSKVRNDSAPLS